MIETLSLYQKFLLTLVLLFCLDVVTVDCKYIQNETDYCNISRQHTLCLYPDCPLKGNCKKVKQNKLTSSEKQLILNKHNTLRNKIALGQVDGYPTAAAMYELVWDEELERIAQCWANQCVLGHDRNRNIAKGYVGQNLAIKGDTSRRDIQTSSVFTEFIQWWYDEIKDFNSSILKSFVSDPTQSRQTGHFTQVIWGKTKRVGCARTFAIEGRFDLVQLTCNYFPGGNFLKQPVYEQGKSASKCRDRKRKSNYTGLCLES